MKISTFRFSVLAFASLAYCYAMQARTLEPQQALNLALQRPVSSRMMAPAQSLTHVYTVNDSAYNMPTVYVFAGRSGGYVITSASDQAVPLLGYSDDGAFDPADINPELEYWLSCYSAQVAQAESNPDVQMVMSRADESRSDIAPLITSTWDQGDPYNQDCPILFGERTVTGCVATAFAQVMRYHQWPQDFAKGQNSFSYSFQNQYGEVDSYTESMDFSTIKFDWANMPDALSTYSPEAQRNAVAQLIHACGVMCNAKYTSNETSASDMNALKGLIEYMDYDKGAQLLSRSLFSLDEWADLLYSELAENRPMVLSGQTERNEGHAFICDGYESSTGYFHINWGWSGRANAYYALTDLTPNFSGIGGGSDGYGYNYNQSVCIGIKPETGDSEYKVIFTKESDFAPILSNNVWLKNDQINFCGDITNLSLNDQTITFGLKLVDFYNPISVSYVDFYNSNIFTTFKPNSYIGTLGTFGYIFPAGKYYASIVYRLITDNDSEWRDLYCGPDIANSILVEANNEYITFNGSELPSDDIFMSLKLANVDLIAGMDEFNRNTNLIVLVGVFSNPSSFNSLVIKCGLKFVNIDNPDIVYYAPYHQLYNIGPNRHAEQWYADAGNVPEGKYIVTPIFQLDGSDEWLDFDYDEQYVHSLTCEIVGDLVKFYEITGIADILNDADAAGVRYFDLMGREVKNPASGIYIRVNGNKSQKVVISE